MFTPVPDGTGLAGAAGEDGAGAGAEVAGWAAGVDVAGDGRGHSRKAPRPARASTMTMKAILRWADVRSIVGNYFRRRIGRSQNGAGPFSPDGAGGDAGADRPGEAGHAGLLAGLSLAGIRSPPDPAPRPAACPDERVKAPPLPHELGAAGPGAWARGAAEPALPAGRGGAPEGADRGAV